jgi:hypothetical protein
VLSILVLKSLIILKRDIIGAKQIGYFWRKSLSANGLQSFAALSELPKLVDILEKVVHFYDAQARRNNAQKLPALHTKPTVAPFFLLPINASGGVRLATIHTNRGWVFDATKTASFSAVGAVARSFPEELGRKCSPGIDYPGNSLDQGVETGKHTSPKGEHKHAGNEHPQEIQTNRCGPRKRFRDHHRPEGSAETVAGKVLQKLAFRQIV